MQNPHLEGDSFFWKAGPRGVLLSHGFTATTAEVRPLAHVLRQSGYTVASPLLPGHGRKDPTEANHYTWLDWDAAITRTYQQLKESCTSIFVGGESLGGLLSLNLAINTPDLAGVLLYAPVIKFRQPLIRILAPLLSHFRSLVPKPETNPGPADELWQGYTVYPVSAFLQLLDLQKQIIRNLPKVTQPLLIVMARQDRSVHPKSADILQTKTKSKIKQLYWMEKSSHCVVLDCERDQVEKITLQFLSHCMTLPE